MMFFIPFWSVPVREMQIFPAAGFLRIPRGEPGGSHRGATGEPPGTSGKVRSLYRRGLGRFVYVYLYILEIIIVFIYLIYITLCYSLFEKSIKQDSNTLDRSERVGGSLWLKHVKTFAGPLVRRVRSGWHSRRN